MITSNLFYHVCIKDKTYTDLKFTMTVYLKTNHVFTISITVK